MGFRRFRISKVQCLCGLQGSNTVSSAKKIGPEKVLFSLKIQRFPVNVRAGDDTIDLHRPTETMLKTTI